MKFHRPAAVLVSAVILTGGAVVAVNAATTTDPIKLCSSSKSGAVSLPNSEGACAKGATEFFVADNSDVQALAGRMDAAEGDISSQGTRLGDVETTNTAQAEEISTLESQVAALEQTVEELEPAKLTMDAFMASSGKFGVVMSGTGLEPGSTVRFHFNRSDNGYPTWFDIGQVDSDGNFSAFHELRCDNYSAYTVGAAPNGDTVTSNVIAHGPICY